MARPGLARHRKFLRLAHALDRIAAPYGEMLARGALEAMWECGYESGDPYLGDATDVEAMAGWRGKSGALFEAMLSAGGDGHAGFIEECGPGRYQIHDLWHHCPDYVRKRRTREAARQFKCDPAALAANSDEALGRALAAADHRTEQADRSLTGQRPGTDDETGAARQPSPSCQSVVDRTPARARAPARARTQKDSAASGDAPPAKTKPVDSRHAGLTTALVTAYETVRGEKYAHGGAKDAVAVKRLMGWSEDDAEIVRRFAASLGDPEEFWRAQSIAHFARAECWNRFAEAPTRRAMGAIGTPEDFEGQF